MNKSKRYINKIFYFKIMKRGLILVFLTALISGVSIFLNKYSVSVINPYIFTFLKNVIVAVFLLSIIIFLKNFDEIKNLTKKQWIKLVLIGLIGGSIPFLLFFKGLSVTSSAIGSFVHKTMFIYVGILAVMFLKEKLNKYIFLSAILLLLGNLLLLKIKNFSFNYGDILIFIATLFWAAENILSKHVLKKVSGNTLAFGRMFFGSIFILIYLGFTKQLQLITTINTSQIIWILFTAVLLLGYVITWYNGIKSVKITTATSILLIGSPITTLLNIVFLGNVAGFLDYAGIFLIILGLATTLFFVDKTYFASSTA